jgi:hypothetical protein
MRPVSVWRSQFASSEVCSTTVFVKSWPAHVQSDWIIVLTWIVYNNGNQLFECGFRLWMDVKTILCLNSWALFNSHLSVRRADKWLSLYEIARSAFPFANISLRRRWNAVDKGTFATICHIFPEKENTRFYLRRTRCAAVCNHIDRIHPIPIDVFVRPVMSPIRRGEAVVSRRSRCLILHKTWSLLSQCYSKLHKCPE